MIAIFGCVFVTNFAFGRYQKVQPPQYPYQYQPQAHLQTPGHNQYQSYNTPHTGYQHQNFYTPHEAKWDRENREALMNAEPQPSMTAQTPSRGRVGWR
jgi:hypothetical protein